jgi:hypothetical protein
LPSWKKHSGASEIIVYTDGLAGFPGTEVRRLPAHTRSDDPLTSWDRKIDVLEDHHKRAHNGDYFMWLDSDCWLTRNPIQAFDCLGNTASVAGGRLVGRCVRGQASANAGVAFFRNYSLPLFFTRWRELSKKFRGSGPITKENKWHEQRAFSKTVLEAFDGLHPFHGAVYSENLYNCEDDNVDKWLDRVRRYKPAILHFKNSWWRNQEYKNRAFAAMEGR